MIIQQLQHQGATVLVLPKPLQNPRHHHKRTDDPRRKYRMNKAALRIHTPARLRAGINAPISKGIYRQPRQLGHRQRNQIVTSDRAGWQSLRVATSVPRSRRQGNSSNGIEANVPGNYRPHRAIEQQRRTRQIAVSSKSRIKKNNTMICGKTQEPTDTGPQTIHHKTAQIPVMGNEPGLASRRGRGFVKPISATGLRKTAENRKQQQSQRDRAEQRITALTINMIQECHRHGLLNSIRAKSVRTCA